MYDMSKLMFWSLRFIKHSSPLKHWYCKNLHEINLSFTATIPSISGVFYKQISHWLTKENKVETVLSDRLAAKKVNTSGKARDDLSSEGFLASRSSLHDPQQRRF